jgi:hypothetical protein
MPKTFDITITIAPFSTPFAPSTPNAPITLPNRSPLKLEVSPANQRVTLVQPVLSPTYVPGSITINPPTNGRGRRLKLHFSVVEQQPTPPVATGAPYFEVGLVFSQVGGGPLPVPDKHGRGGFPDFTVDDDGLVVTDAFSFKSEYDFLLLIQNVNGGMALVDPRISNK